MPDLQGAPRKTLAPASGPPYQRGLIAPRVGTLMANPTEALSALATFIRLFNEGRDLDGILDLFSPDAQFWGTTQPEFGTDSGTIRQYFGSAFARRAGATVTASITGSDLQAVAADVVTVLGHWQIERGDSVNRLRFSLVMNNRDGRWLIVQFHSSPRPGA
jgi:ketosteroid isomerase-like protein